MKGEPDPWSPYDKSLGGYWEGGTHWSEVVTNETVQFLKDASQRSKPFFMYVAFNAPHDPRQAPKAFVDLYPLDSIEIPASFMPQYPWKDSIGCGPDLRDEKLAPFPRTEYAVKVHRREYYAIISHMDAQIKSIMKTLEETGAQDNTYIIFTADHGLACGHHGLMGKQNMYEHSMRAPLLIAGPNIPKNQQIDVLAYIQDVMPTTLELAGIVQPPYVEYTSLAPLLHGNKQKHYDQIFGSYMDLQRMTRDERYKLMVYPKSKTFLLFDLQNDPGETNNLADKPAHKPTVQRLLMQLKAQQSTFGDTLDIDNYLN